MPSYPYSYQDIVQPVVRYSWETTRQHELAREFVSGSTQSVSIGQTVLTGVPLTLACFFNVTNITDGHVLVSIGDESVTDQWILLRATGNVAGDPLRAHIRGGGTAQSAATSIGYSANVWQHGCAVFDAVDDRTIYLNGGSSGNDTNSVTPTNIDHISIGATANSADTAPMDGRTFWPCAWKVGLNAIEAKRLASGVPPWWVRPESIISCPHMGTLYDPFLEGQFTNNNGSVTATPYRDWTLPDDADILGSAVGAAADTITKIVGAGGLAGGHRLAGDGGGVAA